MKKLTQKMIIRASLAVLFCGLVPAISCAAPCAPGSLASYIALGSGGCTIGASQFFNFVDLPLLGGSTTIADNASFVNPLGISTPGFRFDVNGNAGPNSLFERRIGFSLSGPGVIADQVFLTGSNVTTDGAVTVVENLCLGSAFGPGGSCSGTPGQLVPFDLGGLGQSLSDSTNFAGKSLVGVIMDITVDGGTDGHAGLPSATTQFTPAAVPESSMLPFAAVGLVAGFAGLRRRRLA